MNTFGRSFRVSIFGESHGNGVGVLIDGCPAGLPLSTGDFLADIERRKPGGPGGTPAASRTCRSFEAASWTGGRPERP